MANSNENKGPIAELVFGVQFDGPFLSNEQIFEFYQTVKETYPTVQEDSPLPNIVEKLDGPAETRILQGFSPRKMFFNKTSSKLVQIQRDRFCFNWRKTEKLGEYPFFKSVFKEFLSNFSLIPNQTLVPAKVNQLELTYVDHVYVKDFDLSDFNPTSIFNMYKFEQAIKNFDHTLHFPNDKINGTLIFHLKSALTREKAPKKVLVLETTCRGFNKNLTLEKWFEEAHDILYNFFVAITTSKAKEKWGLS